LLNKLEEHKLVQVGFWSGTFTFLMGLSFLFIVPLTPAISNHSGLHFTMLSLELASTPEEVFGVLGKPGDITLDQRVFKYLQIIDMGYLFIFFYSLYGLTLFEKAIRMITPSAWIRAFVYFLLTVLVSSNVYENFLLNEVLSSGVGNFQKEILTNLYSTSMIKWFCFFTVSAVIGILILIGSRIYFFKVMGLLLFLPFLFIWLSFKKIILIEIGLIFIFPTAVLFWFYFGIKMINFKQKKV